MSAAPPSQATLLVTAARCWRRARDRGVSSQPRLYAMLAPLDLGLLAPAFDSFMALCEAAFGRPIRVGSAPALSQDESLMLRLIDGSQTRRACFHCDAGTGSALDCAICSMRVMLRLRDAAGSRA
jgi:hypothetical protein